LATAAAHSRSLGRQLVAAAPSLPHALALAVVVTLAAGVAVLVVATTAAAPVSAPAPASSVSSVSVSGSESGATVVLPDEPLPVAARSHVVQPGDTLWGIATSLQGEGDVRPLVDELARRVGPGGLQPGQRLSLDGLVGR
jgi:nucleoid-associated protein YgaU